MVTVIVKDRFSHVQRAAKIFLELAVIVGLLFAKVVTLMVQKLLIHVDNAALIAGMIVKLKVVDTYVVAVVNFY